MSFFITPSKQNILVTAPFHSNALRHPAHLAPNVGFAGVYRMVGEENQPMRFAHEHGCRLYDYMDPFSDEMTQLFSMMPGMIEEFSE